MGVPFTGLMCTKKEVIVVLFSKGKEVEALEFADQLSMLQQLGIKPLIRKEV